MISFKNVTYKINNKTILENVTFNIKRNEKVLIVGPSGSGKTTIFNLLLKNINDYKGQITYEKTDLKDIVNDKLLYFRKNQITVISQNDDLYENMTVLENISLFYYKQDIIKILKQVGLLHLKDRYIYSLSGGERQRISIIKASLSACNVLLCDEITSALDDKNALKIIEFILRVFKDKTIIFISHKKELFDDKIDHIIMINDKRVEKNIIINDIKNNVLKEKVKKRKSLLKVAITQSLKRISFSSYLLLLLSTICIFMSLNYDSIFNYFSSMSYKKYIDYDVLLIKNNKDIKANNIDIFPSVNKQLENCKITINDLTLSEIRFTPFYNESDDILLVSDILARKYNIDEINNVKIKSDLIDEQFKNIKIIKDDNLFSYSCIYYDIKYFNKYYDENIDNDLYIINYQFINLDDRFTYNPLYKEIEKEKPYLENNAYLDYLTFLMVFESIQLIIDYFFKIILVFTIFISVLINISLIYKDKKQIAIYISQGYSDFQILLFYLIPLFVYLLLEISVILISKLFIVPLIIAFIIQVLSITFSYYINKRKTLSELLKSEYLS